MLIKNRLDLNDVWKLVQKGERVTLWSMGAATEQGGGHYISTCTSTRDRGQDLDLANSNFHA